MFMVRVEFRVRLWCRIMITVMVNPFGDWILGITACIALLQVRAARRVSTSYNLSGKELSELLRNRAFMADESALQ